MDGASEMAKGIAAETPEVVRAADATTVPILSV